MWTILLTGLLAILASGVGQFIGGWMADRRASKEQARQDREAFLSLARVRYLEAIEQLESPFRRLPLGVGTSMLASLLMLDPTVAKAYADARRAHLACSLRVDALATRLLGTQEPLTESDINSAFRTHYDEMTGDDVLSGQILHYQKQLVAMPDVMKASLGVQGESMHELMQDDWVL